MSSLSDRVVYVVSIVWVLPQLMLYFVDSVELSGKIFGMWIFTILAGLVIFYSCESGSQDFKLSEELDRRLKERDS